MGTGPPCPVGDGDLSAPSGGELTSPTCELTPSPSAGNAPSSLLGITAEDERVLKRVEVVEMLQLQHVNPHPVKPGGEGKALSQVWGVSTFLLWAGACWGQRLLVPALFLASWSRYENLYVLWERCRDVVVFRFPFSPAPWQAALSTWGLPERGCLWLVCCAPGDWKGWVLHETPAGNKGPWLGTGAVAPRGWFFCKHSKIDWEVMVK